MKKTRLPSGRRAWHINPGETDVLVKELWGRDAYLSPEPHIALSPGAVVLDVGANVGLFSLFVDERLGGDVTLHAFEPIPEVYAVCAANARDHATRMIAHPFGLSDRAGTATFLHHPKMTLWSTAHPDLDRARADKLHADLDAIIDYVVAKEQPWLRLLPRFLVRWAAGVVARAANETREVEVPLRRLSDVIAEEGLDRIDLLKIDVEGSEAAVLRGLDDAHWPLVRQVVAEVENDAARAEIEALLTARGFTTSFARAMAIHDTGIEDELAYLWAWRD